MLLDSKYVIVPSLKFTLTFDNDVRKVILVKTGDTITCSYKKNGERFSITGIVSKIGCNFNSSLGTVGTTAYLQVDGSSEYSGQVEYIQPSQVLDLTIIKTTDIVSNVVCSVDNEDQRITLIRENEVGVFQYSLDGITWRAATGAQGMSAYECACELGFVGSEEEWLASLKGEPGEPGEAGALEIYKVFKSLEAAEENRDLIPKGKLVAVVLEDQTILLVRNGSNKPGVCPCCHKCIIDGEEVDTTVPVQVKGYDYLGYLSVGPAGPKGDPGEDGKDGKSAYEYAVEGGFPGTEAEFMHILGRSAVAVTSYFMGPNPELTNTVIGPIDLRVFGFTELIEGALVSKEVSKIDISCSSELEDQSIIFPEPIILRAVPTSNEAAKPNLTIDGQKYVSDCIMEKDGKVGVFRRIRYIESYNGETILGDWMSSTGELDLGAEVQFISYGKFEPFDDLVQSEYRKLHTYDHDTKITVTEEVYVSVVYPIDIQKYVEEYVSVFVDEYLHEAAPAIIEDIVEEELDRKIDEKTANKQDKLTAGDHIEISDQNVISVVGLDIPDGKTLAEYVSESIDSAKEEINNTINETKDELNKAINEKQDKLTAGENISISEEGVISSSANTKLAEALITTADVGGIPAGTVFEAGTDIIDIITQLLAPSEPPVPPSEECVYIGISDEIPSDISGLEKIAVSKDEVIAGGYSYRYTANDQYLVFAYKKDFYADELVSIKDPSGFEQLDGWGLVDNNEYFIYYSLESLTISRFKLTFIFTD